jgi:predicted CXXCH cytochrome family protein
MPVAHPRRSWMHAALAAVVAGCVLAACAGASRSPAPPTSPIAMAPGSLRSNVARADYAGSAACAACHPDVTASWMRSPMHQMTRDARTAPIRAPFDGTRWPFHDDTVVLERDAADRFVRVLSADGDRRYRVTRLIGGRTREDYVGVDADAGGDEMVLPVSFVYATGSLRYKGYSVMVHERATAHAGPVWSRTCIFCHNTVPEMDRLLGAVAGGRAHSYQGELVDSWLPPERRASTRVVDDAEFARVAGDEIARLGGSRPRAGDAPREVARRAIDVVRAGYDGSALIELGVGCEACHGGSREHAANPRVRPSLVATAPWLRVDLPAGGSGSAPAVNRVCARCHQVLFSRYPFTWEGGRRDATAGGSHINSGEARDFLLGGCASSMACTRCHDPHGGGDDAAARALRALATPAGNSVCTDCHRELAGADRLRAHAHHDPAGDGASCVACHMPRKNMGLDGRLTRYHRVGSPTDPARVLGDRPVECALCHADRTVADLVDTMERWWPVRYPRQRLQELYGSLDANVIRATLERGKPHEKAVAIGVLAEKRATDAAPLVAHELTNEYPLVREWARRALDAMGVHPAADARAAAPPPASSDEEPED